MTSSPHFLPLLAVLFFAWLAAKPLFGTGYFNMHDDLQMMRQLDMEKCFIDLQIPCRWIPDMGYGFGYPLFNFYPPLPYLVGQLFRLVGYSFMDTAKALFITAFFASAVTMYFLARKFFGRLGGVISSIFYVWAPYHAVDIYVRGAMNESWGLIWFPLILLFSYNLISHSQKRWFSREQLPNVVGIALSWAALLTSHNLMVIVFTPFFALWCLAWLVYHRNWKTIPFLVASGVWAFALAAFFTLPVFLEKNIVQTDTLVKGYYEYTAHFPSAAQLFISRFWGYGPSVWMTQDDKMSFQIGWFHWIIPIAVVLLLGIKFIKSRKVSPLLLAVGVLFLTGWFATFMAHPRSTPIWAHISALQFIQFPWRYLTIVIFGFSFVAGAVVTVFRGVTRYVVAASVVILVLAYSWNFFVPEHGKLGPLTDGQKFTGAAWELQQTAGIYDYLPNTAKTAPKAPRGVIAEVMKGKGTITSKLEGTNHFAFEANITEDSLVRINQLAFPNWKVTVDGSVVDSYVPETEEWGRFYVPIPKGDHKVEVRLEDTPVRTVGNIITLISWVLLALILIGRRNTLVSAHEKQQEVSSHNKKRI